MLGKNIWKKFYKYLINFFGVNFIDHKKCYKELKAEIQQKQIEIKEVNEILETEKNMEDEPKNENNDFFDIEKLKKALKVMLLKILRIVKWIKISYYQIKWKVVMLFYIKEKVYKNLKKK